jgi:hypothetical protein
MSLKGKTLLKGHTLILEGAAMGMGISPSTGSGVGGCSCGARSPELPSRAARKRWHKDHKAEVRARLASASAHI